MVTFKNSYVITNRLHPWNTVFDIEPLPGGTMWFFTAPNPYDPEPTDYQAVAPSPSTTAPASFLTALTADLQAQGSAPQLTILIHGISTLLSDAIGGLSQMGNGLQQYASYGGLVIVFDWPSYDEIESGIDYSVLPYSFPPAATSGNIRGNVNGSAAAFRNLLAMIASLQGSLPGLHVNVVCHSEGNYMLMLGMHDLAQAGGSAGLSQVLMLAADINTGALQLEPADAMTGQGLAISRDASRVTVYYNANDTVLAGSELAYEIFHNPEYSGRLGLEGPASYLSGALAGNVIGLDCSAVLNRQALRGILPPNILIHSAYFYVPQVLADMAATLNGTAAGQVPNRVDAGAEDGQHYQMQLQPRQHVRAVRRATPRVARAGLRVAEPPGRGPVGPPP
jgi:esterase/lipase superfamily enzyme